MKFSRHFFTASRRKGGFYTLAQTQDLDEDFVQSKVIGRSLLFYSKPTNIDEPKDPEDLAKYPGSLRFFVIDGKRFFSTIYYNGPTNHTNNRFGNYFADTIIANDIEEIDFESAAPFNVFTCEKIDWIKSVSIEEEKEIPEHLKKLDLSFEKDNQRLMLNKIVEEFHAEQLEQQISTLSLVLNTILEEALTRPRKKIVLYGNEPEIRRWILMSTGLFPSKFLKFISFTTYFNDPVYSPFFISGLIPECGISPTSLEKDGEKYKVILLDSPSPQNTSYGNEYVQLVCTLIEQKDVEEIAELLNEDYDSFGVTQLDSSLNQVAKFRIILNKIKAEDINFIEIFAEFENLRESLLTQGVNIAPKKVILFEKAANVNPGALNEFFTSELQASTTQAALETITLLYKDYYLQYLKPENSEGADNLNYPNQFLEYSLKQASDNLKPLDFSRLCLDLFMELKEHLDQINPDVLNLMGVAAVKLLEPELLNATEQLPIRDQLRPLNLKYKLNLNLEPEFEVHEVVDDIEKDITEGKSWSEKIRLFFKGAGKKVSNVLTYLKKLLTPLFKKKLSKDDWKDLIVLTHTELKITDTDLIAILKNQAPKPDFSIEQWKYFFRNAILFSSKLGFKSFLETLLKDDQVLQLIVLDDFVENLEGYADLKDEEHVKRILSLLKEKTDGDKS